MKSNDITILISYYNTKYEIFKETLMSLKTIQIKKNNKSPIIIINDGSDKKFINNIYKIIKEIDLKNITVYHLEKNMNLTYCIWYGLSKVNTKYTMRLDSDDIIYYVPTCNIDVDVIFKYKTAESHEKWLKNDGNSHLPGIVMRTDMYKKMYDNYMFFKKYEKEIHEDTYHLQRFLLIYKNNFTWCRTLNSHYIYRSHIGIMAKEKKKTKKEIDIDIIKLLKNENLY